MKNYVLLSLVGATLQVASFLSPAAEVDFFLKIPSIPGESTAIGHESEIVLDAFKAGAVQKALSVFAGGGSAAGKSQFLPLKVYKNVDSASPRLFVACATGERIPNAVLSASHRVDGPGQTFFTITLTGVVIASVNAEVAELDGNDSLIETVTLSYTTMEWSYRPQNPDGSLGPAITGAFDLRSNKRL